MNDKLNLREILKDNLSRLQEPVLFQNMLQKSKHSYDWKLLNWNISDLINIFGDKPLPFRIGDHNKLTSAIQHEQCSVKSPRRPIQLTFGQFIDKVNNLKDNKKWYYCDYKHMADWFTDKPEIIESFNWLKFGIDKDLGKNGHYSTIWIGSKGAHTDCHRDSYGYNLIAQVHGRKLWLLYPPSDALVPVRVPYEESTIYSRLNIYSLSDEEKNYLLESVPDKPKLIILEPGDVLFVPNGWWHYVESLDAINISVNIWGNLKTDNRARVQEALVKLLVAKIANVEEDNINMDKHYYTKIVEGAVIKYKNIKEEEEEKKIKTSRNTRSKTRKRTRVDEWTAQHLNETFPHYVKLLKDAKQREFEEFLQERSERNVNIEKQRGMEEEDDVPQFESFLEDLLNALCHPDVINKAAEVLLERYT